MVLNLIQYSLISVFELFNYVAMFTFYNTCFPSASVYNEICQLGGKNTFLINNYHHFTYLLLT